MFFDASSSASGAYPPHSRPRFWHLMQPGFVSSHFTRRCLYGISKGDLSESNEVRSASFAKREVGSLARRAARFRPRPTLPKSLTPGRLLWRSLIWCCELIEELINVWVRMPQCHRSYSRAKIATSRVVGIWGRGCRFFRSCVFGLVAFDLSLSAGQMALYRSILMAGRARP